MPGSAATKRRPVSSWTSAARSICAAFTLADPYRVVVDMPQVVFQLPPKTGESGRGLIKAFRFGLVMQGGSRMVLRPRQAGRGSKRRSCVDADRGQPARLVLDLSPTDRESFLRRDRRREPRRRAPICRRDRRAARHKTAIRVRSSCSIPAMAASTTAPRRPSGEQEKDIVLDFAQRLRERIEKSGKYRVLMTRTDDTFVPLAERVRIARDAGARCSSRSMPTRCRTAKAMRRARAIYTLSETASDSEAARLAEKENRADVIAGVDLKRRAGRRRRHPDRSRRSARPKASPCNSPASWSAK